MINTIVKLLARKPFLNILTYHRVHDAPYSHSSNSITIEQFSNEILWLSKHFNVLPLSQAIALAEEGKLPPRAVAITVDDGYEDSYRNILPVLKKHNVSATFFIATGGIEDGMLWDEKIAACIQSLDFKQSEIVINASRYDTSTYQKRLQLSQLLIKQQKYRTLKERHNFIYHLSELCNKTVFEHQFLRAEQIAHLHKQGMEIGSHTHEHPILELESDETCIEQIQSSKTMLEDIIAAPVSAFAYPNGKYGNDYTERHVRIVEELGFDVAFSTNVGKVKNITDGRYQIKRFTPWAKSELAFCSRLALTK